MCKSGIGYISPWGPGRVLQFVTTHTAHAIDSLVCGDLEGGGRPSAQTLGTGSASRRFPPILHEAEEDEAHWGCEGPGGEGHGAACSGTGRHRRDPDGGGVEGSVPRIVVVVTVVVPVPGGGRHPWDRLWFETVGRGK